MKTKISYGVMVLALVTALAAGILAGYRTGADEGASHTYIANIADNGGSDIATQLAMILDSSVSISDAEWSTMINGLAQAVGSSSCVPHDGSVELTVVQFGKEWAHLEVGPVIITAGNVSNVVDDILGISWYSNKIGGHTPTACGIYLAADTLAASPNFDPSIKQVLNLVTDGVPNRCCPDDSDYYQAWDCIGGEGSCHDEGCQEARDSAEAARDYAISLLAMTTDQDEFDVEGIGITDTNRDWLKGNITYPQPGHAIPPEAWPQPPGWVRVVNTFQDFADTICEKLQLMETHTWTFYAAGFFPKHLPDSYDGQVVLADLDPADIPAQVQGVWWYDGPALGWKFWVPGVGGELTTLGGGHSYNYQVLVTGACEWVIRLP